MAKNSIFDPTKDGVKADNSGYSSNQIDKMIGESAAALIDDEAAGDDTVYSSAKIYSLLPEDTATGAEVTITDACPDLPIVEGIFNIDANLDGVTEVTISNDTEDVIVTLTDPCYGGTVETDGTVTVTHDICIDLGALNWTKRNTSTGHWRFTTQDLPLLIAGATSDVASFSCELYESKSAANTYAGITGVSNNTTISQLCICDETCEDVPALITKVSGYKLSYPLNETSSYTIDPFIIKTLPEVGSTNIISCDTGDVTITYKKLTALS